MSTFFMDKMMSPLDSRRNSAIIRKPTINEDDNHEEDNRNPLDAEPKKRRKLTVDVEEEQCKQYVYDTDEGSVESPTRGCSTCLDCTV